MLCEVARRRRRRSPGAGLDLELAQRREAVLRCPGSSWSSPSSAARSSALTLARGRRAARPARGCTVTSAPATSGSRPIDGPVGLLGVVDQELAVDARRPSIVAPLAPEARFAGIATVRSTSLPAAIVRVNFCAPRPSARATNEYVARQRARHVAPRAVAGVGVGHRRDVGLVVADEQLGLERAGRPRRRRLERDGALVAAQWRAESSGCGSSVSPPPMSPASCGVQVELASRCRSRGERTRPRARPGCRRRSGSMSAASQRVASLEHADLTVGRHQQVGIEDELHPAAVSGAIPRDRPSGPRAQASCAAASPAPYLSIQRLRGCRS